LADDALPTREKGYLHKHLIAEHTPLF
jgi:hypothetical protein